MPTAERGTMAQQDCVVEVAVEDIGLDQAGRVAVMKPEAERLLAARRRKQLTRPPIPNTNCQEVCNTASGCGPINKKCNPNTVSNCGCRKLE
jgi:hypothetical protein